MCSPPMSLKVGTKGVPEAGEAVVYAVQSPRGVLVPVGLYTAQRVPRGPAGGGSCSCWTCTGKPTRTSGPCDPATRAVFAHCWSLSQSSPFRRGAGWRRRWAKAGMGPCAGAARPVPQGGHPETDPQLPAEEGQTGGACHT